MKIDKTNQINYKLSESINKSVVLTDPILKIGLAILGIGLVAGVSHILSPSFASATLINNTEKCPLPFTLQEKIDALNWSEKLSANPPRPNRSYPIKREQAENWVNTHPCEVQKIAARKLIEGTVHINQTEFEFELKNSVDQFNEWLNAQENKDYVIIVTEERLRKSNRWVAELALPHLKILPKEVLSFTYGDFGPTEVIEYYKNNPSTNKFILFDDAAYSCLQMSQMLEALKDLDLKSKCGIDLQDCTFLQSYSIKRSKKNFSLSTIIPFMRSKNCVNPFNFDHINIFNTRKMATISDILSPEESKYILCNQDKSPVYFDHKLADGVSTCTRAYLDGSVSYYTYCDENPVPYTYWDQLRSLIGNLFSTNYILTDKMFNRATDLQHANAHIDKKFIDPIHPPYKHPK